MKILECDLHAKQQTIAMVDTETGEFTGGGHRYRSHAVVFGSTGKVGDGVPGGTSGEDSGSRDPETEA